MNGRRGKSAAWILLCFLATTPMGGCIGGTSSETDGLRSPGLVIAAAGGEEITGRTDAGNAVGLYGAEFKPHLDSGFARTATADAAGRFAFTGLAPGPYRLLVRHPEDRTAALVSNLMVPAANDTAEARLEPTGSVSGTITDSAEALMGIVYVPGTPFFALGDSLKHYSLSGLPPGSYPIVKSWKRPGKGCQSGVPCGFLESRQDSTVVRIESGQSAVW